MRRRRTLLIALGVVVAGLVITAAVVVRKHSPPEPARLLPEADTYLYFNLAPLRLAGVMKSIPAVPREPDYEQFVRETGFEFERDLDEAAFAVHAPSRAGEETHYSEVFVGRIDLDRARAYLRKLAKTVDQYRGRNIFNIPLQGRTVRVVILGVGMVAVSNVDDPMVIRGMVDRDRQIALPMSGPALLRQYYARVPWGSLGWAIARVTASPATGNRAFVLPGGFDLFFPGGTVIVASARYLGEVQLRAEAITANADDAQRLRDQLNAFVALFRGVESSAQLGGPDKDVKAFFDSLQVTPEGNNVVMTATAPKGFFSKLLAEGPETSIGGGPEPAPQKPPEKAQGKTKKK
jgi:hypothetical protein